MAIRKLTLDQIQHLDDGRVSTAVDLAIAAAVRDCENRPGNKKPRTVTLQIAVKPHLDESGRCYECDFLFGVKTTVPQANSAVYRGAVKADGALAFNDLSDDNPQQGTLDDESPSAFE